MVTSLPIGRFLNMFDSVKVSHGMEFLIRHSDVKELDQPLPVKDSLILESHQEQQFLRFQGEDGSLT